MAVAIVAVVVWQMGWYPVARVNGDWIWGSVFETNVAMTRAYYGDTQENLAQAGGEEFDITLKGLVLTGLIDDKIVERFLEETMGKEEYNNQLQQRIREVSEDSEFVNQLQTMLNTSADNVEQYFLATTLRYELLEQALEGDNTLGWLEEKSSQATVQIWARGFEWNGREAVASGRE